MLSSAGGLLALVFFANSGLCFDVNDARRAISQEIPWGIAEGVQSEKLTFSIGAEIGVYRFWDAKAYDNHHDFYVVYNRAGRKVVCFDAFSVTSTRYEAPKDPERNWERKLREFSSFVAASAIELEEATIAKYLELLNRSIFRSSASGRFSAAVLRLDVAAQIAGKSDGTWQLMIFRDALESGMISWWQVTVDRNGRLLSWSSVAREARQLKPKQE
jgi:hypothetical protein